MGTRRLCILGWEGDAAMGRLEVQAGLRCGERTAHTLSDSWKIIPSEFNLPHFCLPITGMVGWSTGPAASQKGFSPPSLSCCKNLGGPDHSPQGHRFSWDNML